ncbi:unnamed protein product [Linum tenue]|uniref:Alginate lyase 2 domain-containing protein n=1 Tax=Linum tenue TaxID=586396 RepID=A0AAV0JHF7_9ROSI|nr:unnamed protein product [Linum tenue]
MAALVVKKQACILITLLTYLVIINAMMTAASAGGSTDHDLTSGFESLPLRKKNIRILKPYDIPLEQRYSFINGIHKCWVYSTDKPHSPASKTLPRTEIGIHGYGYRSGVWQFEGYGYVPKGTTGVCIMQIFGATAPRASSAMVRVYDGKLMFYRRKVLAENIYDKWFRLNVIHDVGASKVQIYIDGELKLETKDGGGVVHTFKCGVYAQNHDSNYMESRWKDLKVFRKL